MCDPNYLSRDAAAMFMDGGVARSLNYFSKWQAQLLKIELDVNLDDRKCDDCIDKAEEEVVAEVDTS